MGKVKRLRQIIGLILELRNLWQGIISLTPLSMTLFSKIRNTILAFFPDKKLPDWFLIILGIFLSTNLGLIFWNFSLRKRVKELLKFKIEFGIYWDKDKNPYSPKCKTPLIEKGKEPIEYLRDPLVNLKPSELFCPSCKIDIPIVDNDVKISLKDAQKKL